MNYYSDTSNIADYLFEMAEQQPDRLAIAEQKSDGSFREHSYRELERVTSRLAGGLMQFGVGRSTRVVVMMRPGFEFFAVVFALFRIGAVLVAVDPGLGVRNLRQCLNEVGPEVFIGAGRAHLARVLFGWGRPTLRARILLTRWPSIFPGMTRLKEIIDAGETLPARLLPCIQPQDPAAILFTSGSTGPPRGAYYTHGNFLAQVRALKELYAIQPGETDLATFPLFALYAPALGMSVVLPDMDFTRPGSFDPDKLFAAIEKYHATTMFGSPALLDRAGRYGIENGIRLPTLKRILSAGAPVAPPVLERFSNLLAEGVEISTPYGATEALPVSSIGSGEVLSATRAMTDAGKGICVGKPAPGIEIRIIAISDEAIPRWREDLLQPETTVGEIAVSGPQVTGSYYNRADATALAKIYGDGGEVFHRMGDTGYLDGSGRLWFCGRLSHRVVGSDRTWFSICCEGVFNINAKVRRSALIALERDDSTVPGLCIEIEAAYKGTDTAILREELLALGERFDHTRDIREIYFHPGFPVDIRHNAKIDRAALSRWAGKLRQ